MMSEKTAKVFPCPRCAEPVDWRGDAPWKPFCSERCKMIDLGAWFAEEHVIPGQPADPGVSTPSGDDED